MQMTRSTRQPNPGARHWQCQLSAHIGIPSPSKGGARNTKEIQHFIKVRGAR